MDPMADSPQQQGVDRRQQRQRGLTNVQNIIDPRHASGQQPNSCKSAFTSALPLRTKPMRASAEASSRVRHRRTSSDSLRVSDRLRSPTVTSPLPDGRDLSAAACSPRTVIGDFELQSYFFGKASPQARTPPISLPTPPPFINDKDLSASSSSASGKDLDATLDDIFLNFERLHESEENIHRTASQGRREEGLRPGDLFQGKSAPFTSPSQYRRNPPKSAIALEVKYQQA